jgi:hypothetical protein
MSILKPENSIIAGLAVVGLVIANYNLHNGTGASVRATDANHPVTMMSNNTAGWSSLILVAGASLLAKDANIFILGSIAVVVMHSAYLEHLAVDPGSGLVAPSGPGDYAPAQLSAVS